jgi:RNA polymerase sigma-70 factor (ECF subfamily)
MLLVDELKDIIKGCLSGERRSQEKLYKLFSSRMFGVCLQYSNDYDDAKDILQEGFIKVFSKLEQFDERGSFEGWVRKIMINTALEKYRSHLHLYPLTEKDMKKEEMVYEEVFERLSANDLVKLVQELPPRYRMVFNLYAIEGYAHKEISEMLGISVGTSKSNLARARGIMQEKVKRYYNSSENMGI